MTFPDDEKPLNGAQQPPEQPDEQDTSGAADEAAANSEPENGQRSSFPAAEETESQFDFPRMEDDVAAFRRELNELRFTAMPVTVEEEPAPVAVVSTPRRRRRTPRITERPNSSELGERLESIIRRAAPTLDFFVFSFLCGCILGIGYILDAQAILLIGILVAPLIGPWVGTAIAVASGEIRVFWQSLGATLMALLMVFTVALLSGFASRIFQPLTSSQAFYHARLWWPDLLMLVIGTVLLVFAFIQSDEKPLMASLMVAYEIFLPVSAAGFGLGAGVQGLWPQAGLVFLIHIALSLIVSLIVFFYMGFRPLEISGYALAASAILIGLVILSGFAGLDSFVNVRGDQVSATPRVIASATIQPSASKPPATAIPSPSPSAVVQATPSLTAAPASATPTITATNMTPDPTLLPTPVYGRVQSESGGVYVRTKPGGATITTVQNGYLVEILGDEPITLEGAIWVHVIIKTPNRDINGWVLLNLILTATPSGSP